MSHVPFSCAQIERLTKLVGRKGFSNNPAAEISDVMALFEGDMAGLQKDIASLQRCVVVMRVLYPLWVVFYFDCEERRLLFIGCESYCFGV